MSIEKTYCNRPQKSSSQQIFFKIYFFRFYFVSPIQYLDCYDNEYPVKQTASLYLKLSLKPVFLVFLSSFGKKSL